MFTLHRNGINMWRTQPLPSTLGRGNWDITRKLSWLSESSSPHVYWTHQRHKWKTTQLQQVVWFNFGVGEEVVKVSQKRDSILRKYGHAIATTLLRPHAKSLSSIKQILCATLSIYLFHYMRAIHFQSSCKSCWLEETGNSLFAQYCPKGMYMDLLTVADAEDSDSDDSDWSWLTCACLMYLN